MESKHYCYILRCKDGTLYTGYTNNLEKRVDKHNAGKGAKYTRGRAPCVLVYYEEYSSKKEAMSREYFIKHNLSKKEKEELIRNGQTR